jgi:hypothetical protein
MITFRAPAALVEPMQVRVFGPDADPVTDADLRRLFPGAALTAERLDRLRDWSRVVAACGPRVVGLATYRRVDVELRAPDFGLDPDCECLPGDIVGALLEALELACLAGGSERIVLMPPPAAARLLARRGYRVVDEGCAGAWAQKDLGI